MATLADVVQGLEQNNKELVDLNTSVNKVESGILGLFALQKGSRLDQLEASRESSTAPVLTDNSPKGEGSDTSSSGGRPLFGGLFDGFFSAAGLSKLLVGGLKKLPFVLMAALGDNLSNFLQSSGFKKELADDIGRSVSFAGLAGIISKRLLPLGALVGLILDEKTQNELKTIYEDFKKKWGENKMGEKVAGFFNAIITPINELFKALGFDFKIDNIDKVSWTGVLTWIRTNLIEGVKGISDILTGEAFKDGIQWEDFSSALGVIGGIAFALSPLSTLKLAGGAVTGTIKGLGSVAMDGIRYLLGGKLLGAVKTLGTLAFGLGDAADAVGPLRDPKTGKFVKKPPSLAYQAGKGVASLAGMALNPAVIAITGAIIAGGALAMLAKESANYDWEKMRNGNANLEETAVTQEELTGQKEVTTPAQLAAAVAGPGSDLYEKETKRLEKLAAQGDSGAASMVAARKKAILEKQAEDTRLTNMLADKQKGQQGQMSPIIQQDNSQTINAPQNSTALVGQGTGTWDANNPAYQRALASMGM